MVELEKNRKDVFGTVNDLELVLARGAGLFADISPKYALDHFDGTFICQNHLEELLTKWDDSKAWRSHFRQHHGRKGHERLCAISTHKRELNKNTCYLTKEQAQKYLHNHNRLYHVGHRELFSSLRNRKTTIQFSAICRAHAEEIDKLPAVEGVETPADMSIDSESEASITDELEEANREEMQTAFTAFAEKAKVKGAGPNLDFGTVQPGTKKRKVYTLKKIVKQVISLMAPNDSDELMRLYLQSMIPKSWTDYSDTKFAKVCTSNYIFC